MKPNRRESTKKPRVMAAAAAGAAAILLASTLARCVAADAPDQSQDDQQQPAIEQVEAAEAENPDSGAAEAESASSGPVKSRAIVRQCESTDWIAADGSGATMQVTEGSVIEKGPDGALAALAYATSSEQQSKNGAVTTLTLEDGSAATLVVELKDGAPASIASDSFSIAKKYVAKAASGPASSGFEVVGLDDRYLALVGGDPQALAGTIGSAAAARYPQATQATFNGEVYLDLATDSVSATFHLNDAAKSIVAVTFQDGKFTVL